MLAPVLRRLGPRSPRGAYCRISSSSPRSGLPSPRTAKPDHLLCQEIAGCAAGSARLLSSAHLCGAGFLASMLQVVLSQVTMVASAAYESSPFRLLRTSQNSVKRKSSFRRSQHSSSQPRSSADCAREVLRPPFSGHASTRYPRCCMLVSGGYPQKRYQRRDVAVRAPSGAGAGWFR